MCVCVCAVWHMIVIMKRLDPGILGEYPLISIFTYMELISAPGYRKVDGGTVRISHCTQVEF